MTREACVSTCATDGVAGESRGLAAVRAAMRVRVQGLA